MGAEDGKVTSYYRMASWKCWHFWGKILPNGFNGEERVIEQEQGQAFLEEMETWAYHGGWKVWLYGEAELKRRTI